MYSRAIGQMSRVFANGPVDRGSIPRRFIPKTQKWYEVLSISFQTFFPMGTFIDSTHMKL